jgi:hypothetical protein
MEVRSFLYVGLLLCSLAVIAGVVGCVSGSQIEIDLEPTPIEFSHTTYKTDTVIQYRIPNRYKALVHDVCAEYDIPVWLFARLIERESGWKPTLVCNDDRGIAQFNSNYHDWFTFKFGDFDPMVPAEALPAAGAYLSWLYGHTGNWTDAVAAWNCGLTRWRSGEWPEITERHVDAVLDI